MRINAEEFKVDKVGELRRDTRQKVKDGKTEEGRNVKWKQMEGMPEE